MITLVLAWRNLWRNSRRSWITISAVSTALACLMALSGLMEGLTVQMLSNGTQLLVGHIQVHNRSYLPERSIYDWVREPSPGAWSSLFDTLEARPEVVAVSPRVYGFALLSTGDRSYGAQVVGIFPELEARASVLLDGVADGQPLPADSRKGILLGTTLARSLEAHPGSEVAIITQAADGSLGNDLYTLTGTFSTGLSYLDRSLALTHIQDLQSLLVLDEGQIHELAVQLTNPMDAARLAAELNGSGLLPEDSLAQSWSDLLPQLREYLNLAGGFSWFLISLVGLFAAFGTLNTMMMAVFERTHEIGTLTSLGMKPLRILSLFLVESALLGIVGIVVGFVGGCLMLYYLSTSGLDLSRWMGELSMLDTRMDPILKADWAWEDASWSAVGLMIAVLLATLIPAVKAARLNPVDALRAPGDT